MRRQRDGSLTVLVVTSGWPSEERPDQSIFVSRQVDQLRALGLRVDVVHYVGARNPINYFRARRDVTRMLARGSYDLIHAHFGQSFVAVYGRRLPLVMTFHGSDVFGVVGPSGRHALRTPVLRWISRAAAGRADRVIVPSEALGAALGERARYEVLPMGIDLARFRPQDKLEARSALGLPHDRRLVLFGGRPSQPVKRYPLARRTVDLLSPPGADLVTIDGVPPSVVPTYMSACDALLVTSLHESGPVMVKEALGCDLPVVSVDVGDVAEWTGGLDGCELCEDEDPTAIAAALERALETSSTFEGRHAVASLDERSIAKRLLEVYRETLGS